MKKFRYVLVLLSALAVIGLAACGSDDDDNVTTNNTGVVCDSFGNCTNNGSFNGCRAINNTTCVDNNNNFCGTPVNGVCNNFNNGGNNGFNQFCALDTRGSCSTLSNFAHLGRCELYYDYRFSDYGEPRCRFLSGKATK